MNLSRLSFEILIGNQRCRNNTCRLKLRSELDEKFKWRWWWGEFVHVTQFVHWSSHGTVFSFALCFGANARSFFYVCESE